MAKVTSATGGAGGTDHPVVAELRARDEWRPGTRLRALSRVMPGVGRVTDTIAALERHWHDRAEAALAGDLPLWVVLGDSTAQGVGASNHDTSWVTRLEAELISAERPHGVVNLSRSGATSIHVLEHQLPLLEALPRPPSLVTCTVGSNDLMRTPWPPTVAARLRRLIEALPATSVVATLPAHPASPSGRIVNRTVRAAATARGLGLADLVPHLRGPRAGTASDGFHPSDEGYGAWYEAFALAIGLVAADQPAS